MQNISVFFNTILIFFFAQQVETSFPWTNSSEAEGIIEEEKVINH